MADTQIEWTDKVWNPVRGCTRVSEGCRNCYAERQAIRQAKPEQPYFQLVKSTSTGPQWTGKVVCDESKLFDPVHWRKPSRVFVNSMSDLFHESVPFEFIDRVYAVIGFQSCAKHTFQILTKRTKRALEYFESRTDKWCDEHFVHLPGLDVGAGYVSVGINRAWNGGSVEDQKTADERCPDVVRFPGVRWISAEPLLGDLDVRPYLAATDIVREHGSTGKVLSRKREGIAWVVVGGESGPRARPMHPDWARSLRDQCHAAFVPFFFKQWGEWYPFMVDPKWPEDASHCPSYVAGNGRAFYNGFENGGKKASGRLLDGLEYSDYPAAPRG